MEAWIGDKKIIDDAEGRKVSMRPAKWKCLALARHLHLRHLGVIRNFRIRKLNPDEIPTNPQP